MFSVLGKARNQCSPSYHFVFIPNWFAFLTTQFLFLPFSQIQIEDVENEEKRYSLFQELLEAAQKWEDFQLLILLLQAWPPMMKEEV